MFTHPDPSSVVAQQLAAYNAHDLHAFVACYAESVRIYHPPKGEPSIAGRLALAEFYRDNRINDPSLHAEVVSRTCVGSLVIDHERIQRSNGAEVDAIAVFEVHDGQITSAWFFQPTRAA